VRPRFDGYGMKRAEGKQKTENAHVLIFSPSSLILSISFLQVLNSAYPSVPRPDTGDWVKDDLIFRYWTQPHLVQSPCFAAVKAEEDVSCHGLTMAEFAQIFTSCSQVSPDVIVHHADAFANLSEWRSELSSVLEDPNGRVVANYDRSCIGQSVGFHFAVIAAYHSESDSFLLLDTARYKVVFSSVLFYSSFLFFFFFFLSCRFSLVTVRFFFSRNTLSLCLVCLSVTASSCMGARRSPLRRHAEQGCVGGRESRIHLSLRDRPRILRILPSQRSVSSCCCWLSFPGHFVGLCLPIVVVISRHFLSGQNY
jgi:Phytochelatin synthase